MASLSSTGPARDQFVVALAALVCHDSGADASSDNLNSVISASGNSVGAYWTPLYAQYIEKAGGVDKFFTKVGSGGGGAAGKNSNLPIHNMMSIHIHEHDSLIVRFFFFLFVIIAPAAGGAAAAAAAPAAAPAPKVEEVDALEGGMDMFGGGGSDY